MKMKTSRKTNPKDTYKIQTLSVTIEKASRCLHSAIRYIYGVSMGDFYNINVKDLFKLSLSDLSNPNVLSNLGISPEMGNSSFDGASVFKGVYFAQLSDVIFYAFAVRTPFLKRNAAEPKIKDRFFRSLFESCVEMGAADSEDVVRENLKQMIKSAKTNSPEPAFNGEWFRRWVYSCGGELAAITNRNMFLLGCMDALIPLYYAKLTDILTEQLNAP
jgi:hypothetical protein